MPIWVALAPWAARYNGASPQASASLRLLTSPACEQARSTGCRRLASANALRNGSAWRSPCHLLLGYVRARVAHEHDRDQRAGERDRERTDPDDRTGRDSRRQRTARE